jgi:hypothetical protein
VQRADLVLVQLVLVGERLQLALVNVAALGGLLDQALGRRQIVQVNRLVQCNPFLARVGPLTAATPGDRRAGSPRRANRLFEL